MTFYLDPDRYDLEYEFKRSDLDFYLAKAKEFSGATLELGAGTGRITIPIHKAGIDITGVEKDSFMIEKAKSKCSNINIIKSDFINLNLNKKFKLVIMPFNAFNHIYTDKDLSLFLKNLKKHFFKNSVFIFDIINPDLMDLNREEDETWFYDSFYVYEECGVLKRVPKGLESSFINKKIMVIEDSVIYDKNTQIATYKLSYSIEGKNEFVYNLTQRMYFPKEIDYILKSSGFKIENKFGSFDEKPFKKDSNSQIFICSF